MWPQFLGAPFNDYTYPLLVQLVVVLVFFEVVSNMAFGKFGHGNLEHSPIIGKSNGNVPEVLAP